MPGPHHMRLAGGVLCLLTLFCMPLALDKTQCANDTTQGAFVARLNQFGLWGPLGPAVVHQDPAAPAQVATAAPAHHARAAGTSSIAGRVAKAAWTAVDMPIRIVVGVLLWCWG